MRPDQSLERKSELFGESSASSSTDLSPAVILTISTAAYISQIAGELATLACNAEIHMLSYLLARAQLEAEFWVRGGPKKG
jgi:hypothetical protein